jgi:tRNA-2-methylthio-N6-dimethylallyladenosine synthase
MKVYIETYGCQMNEYDTEIVKSILKDAHYDITEQPEKAGVIFINTCSVREHAHQKARQRLDIFRKLRRANKNLLIGVLGCMAQNLRQELLENSVAVDILAGPDSYKKLPDIIQKVRETGDKEFDLTLSDFETYSDVFPTHEQSVNAWIAVMRGCENFCTFCVVPYTRGRERSREPGNVLEEVKRIADLGFQQITLLGQNVNSYHSDGCEFADLVNLISKVDGIRRIRFMSPHPKDFPEKLIEEVAENDKVCKQIHLPLQAGNDRILQLMNRTYSRKDYLKLTEKLRKKIPDLTLSTDVIVGFPTETIKEFEDTLTVMREIKFDLAFMFKYSQRKQTIAARKYPDDVPEEEKTSRITRLVDLQRNISYQKNLLTIGTVFQVLIEGPAKKNNQLMGRNDGNKIVVFENEGQRVGAIVKVKIEEATPNTLIGRCIA